MPAGYPLANASPCWTRWWVGTKCDESPSFSIWLPCLFQKAKKEPELMMTWIRTRTMSFFLQRITGQSLSWLSLLVKSYRWAKLSPFAVQKGFQAIAGTLKSTKRLRDEPQTFCYQTWHGDAVKWARVSRRTKIVCCLQGQGHSAGSYYQNMTLTSISSELLILLRPGLIWW